MCVRVCIYNGIGVCVCMYLTVIRDISKGPDSFLFFF